MIYAGSNYFTVRFTNLIAWFSRSSQWRYCRQPRWRRRLCRNIVRDGSESTSFIVGTGSRLVVQVVLDFEFLHRIPTHSWRDIRRRRRIRSRYVGRGSDDFNYQTIAEFKIVILQAEINYQLKISRRSSQTHPHPPGNVAPPSGCI